MTPADIHGLLADLAVGDLQTFAELQPKFAKAFQVRLQNGNRTIVVRYLHRHDLLHGLRGLARTAARGLALVSNDSSNSSSSSSSSCNSRLFSYERAVACIAGCCEAMPALSQVYTNNVVNSCESRRAQVEVAVLTQAAGLVDALSAASVVTAHILEQQQQQQSLHTPQQSSHTGILDLASSQLVLFSSLADFWPAVNNAGSSSSSLFSSSQQLSRAALPATQLAVALLAAPGSSDVHRRAAIVAAATLVGHLSLSIQQSEQAAWRAQCMPGAEQPADNVTMLTPACELADFSSTLSEPVQQLLQSVEFLKVLAAHQAGCAQRLPDLQPDDPCLQRVPCATSSSSSSSSRRQQGARRHQVPAAAWPGDAVAQLLQAAGMNCLSPNMRGIYDSADAVEPAVARNVSVLRYVLVQLASLQLQNSAGSSGNSCSTPTADHTGSEAGTGAVRSSSSSGACTEGKNNSTGQSTQPPQQSALLTQQQQQAFERLLAPMALMLIQLLCRFSQVDRKAVCMETLLVLVQTAAIMGEPVLQPVVRTVLEPVLLQLLPHLQDLLQASGCGRWFVSSSTSAGGSSSSSSSSGDSGSDLIIGLEERLSSLLLWLSLDVDRTAALSLIVSSKPDVFLAAYEASLRCSASSDLVWSSIPERAMATAGIVTGSEAAMLKLATCCAEQPQLLQQLLALQVTCLKCAQRAASGQRGVIHCGSGVAFNVARACVLMLAFVPGVSSTAMAGNREAAAACAATSAMVAASEGTEDSSSSSSSSSSSMLSTTRSLQRAAAAAAAPLVAVQARSLLLAAAALQPRPADQQPERATQQLTGVGLSICRECAALSLQCLARSGLPQGILQPLQLLCAGLVEQLTALHAAVAVADYSTQQQLLADAQQAGLQQQVRSFAQAVVARTPLSSACNSPGCVSLAQRSELLLVGGKGCVCGRCKAARYCCKACQVEHWPMHKALCKELSRSTAGSTAS